MRIQLSDHFTYARLLRFSLPSMIMMLFTSIYGIVDGLFVSNFVGTLPFAALNLVLPYLFLLTGPGYMLGTGGTAVIASTLGRGRSRVANGYFSKIVLVTALSGIAIFILGQILLEPVMRLFGAEGELLALSLQYGRIVLIGLPFMMLLDSCQSFFVAAEKPKLGLLIIVVGGFSNAVLDALFIVVFGWGLIGAATATVIGMVIGAIWSIWYFRHPNDSLLHLGRPYGSKYMLWRVCSNGLSEMLSMTASSIVTFLYNYQLMKWAGPDGIAAYGIIMYISFIFAAVYIGYALGAAPIVSYHYGAKNRPELENVFCRSMHILIFFGLATVILLEAAAVPLTGIFVGYDPDLWQFTLHGLRLYSLAFFISSLNYFASAFFTALNNGRVSAILAFSRTMLWETASVLILPQFLGLLGIWLAFPVSELLSFLGSLYCYVHYSARYGYRMHLY